MCVTRSLLDNVLDIVLDIVYDNECVKSSADLGESFKKGWEITEEIFAKKVISNFTTIDSSSTRYVTQASPPINLLTLFEEAISIN